MAHVHINTMGVDVTIESDGEPDTDGAFALWKRVYDDLAEREPRLSAGGFGLTHTEIKPDW